MTAETAWQRRTRREAARAAYVAEHGNRCELCGNEPKSRGLSEDHDHKTGAHRGWLCYRCNRALPAYVTLKWLRRAVAYLERAGSASAAADEPGETPPNDEVVEKMRRLEAWLERRLHPADEPERAAASVRQGDSRGKPCPVCGYINCPGGCARGGVSPSGKEQP